MKIFETHISPLLQKFFQENFNAKTSLETANTLLQSTAGIVRFFDSISEFQDFKEKIFHIESLAEECDRAEYGDFQTNLDLAQAVVKYLSNKVEKPDVVIEPTCGKGNFILAALKKFSSLKKIYGIEIYRPYVWQTKISILEFFLENLNANKPEIVINHYNVFDFDFSSIASEVKEQNILILGNPPWVTNSMLGSLNSKNLPIKSNFKNHNGLDAMTGKGNFDIAEYIMLMLLDTFQHINGYFALLVKNSVIKNVVFDQNVNGYKIGNLERHCIDSKKEFNASVDASLFFCQLNVSPSYECKEFNFYKNSTDVLSFGWVDEKFVSNIESYVHSKHIDGVCPFEWRQGLKHDCSAIMELDKVNGHYVNGLKEVSELENELVYGILKSSDLKNTVIKVPRKYTIVTQRKVGQDTSYIKSNYPKTYQYLSNHQSSFDARKSSIYKDKPSFSIFGIGEYSFKPFKVVISGLYKTFHFTLVLPENQKPLMLDDTCYMLGFDRLDYAVYTLVLLNSGTTKELLQSITFPDAKRTFTKDVLMRIDLHKLGRQFSLNELKKEIENLNKHHSLNITVDNWNAYIDQLRPIQSEQIALFA